MFLYLFTYFGVVISKVLYDIEKVGVCVNSSNNKSASTPYNMKEEFFKPPYGFYVAGFIWLIYGFIFPLYRWFDFILVTLLSIIAFAVVNKVTPSKKILVPKKEKPISSGNREVDTIINSGVSYLNKIRATNDKISDPKLSEEILRMEKATDKIFRYIAKNPSSATQVRKFMNYYLPTTLKLLNSYINLKEDSISGENISKTLSRIENILATIADAFEKQLYNLLEDQALDVSTDITVLEAMLAQEGLSNKNTFK